MILRLKKAYYGLIQCLHIWYCTFRGFLILIGFESSRLDVGLLVLHDEDDVILIITAIRYMDDLHSISNQASLRQSKNQTKNRFEMHDLRSVPVYIGMKIKHKLELYTSDIHRYRFIQKIVAKFRMDES